MQNNQNNFKDSKLYRNFKENRAVYITAITLLIALAVIVSVTAIANRSKKPPEETETESNITTDTETETKAPDSTDVMDKLPTFALPVNGTLAKSHDATTQVFSDTVGRKPLPGDGDSRILCDLLHLTGQAVGYHIKCTVNINRIHRADMRNAIFYGSQGHQGILAEAFRQYPIYCFVLLHVIASFHLPEMHSLPGSPWQ